MTVQGDRGLPRFPTPCERCGSHGSERRQRHSPPRECRCRPSHRVSRLCKCTRRHADEPDQRGFAPTRADSQFAWHRRRRRWRMILNQLDRRLGEEHLIGVNEFDVLITLDTSDGHPRSMSDIAEAVTLSPAASPGWSNDWRVAASCNGSGTVRRAWRPRFADRRRLEVLGTSERHARRRSWSPLRHEW